MTQIEYRESAASKTNDITYHLAITDEWMAQKDGNSYKPYVFDSDGFIHCTNGLDLLTQIANMFYQESPDPRVVLVLDMRKITSEVRYDDPDETFPHIYGPLNPDAVIAELPVQRGENGEFLLLGNA